MFSPYLDPASEEKRRFLARVVCESLILYFPGTSANTASEEQKSSEAAFQLVVPWSGARHLISTASDASKPSQSPKKRLEQTVEEKDGEEGDSKDASKKTSATTSMRASAERVLQRHGRVFRAVVKVGRYELLLSLYTHKLPANANANAHSAPSNAMHTNSDEGSKVTRADESESEAETKAEVAAAVEEEEELLIFNFYCPPISQSAEIVVDRAQQVERHPQGRLLLSYREGAARATAIRRFVREFIDAQILEDLVDPTIKQLLIALRPPTKHFVNDYKGSGSTAEELRPVGIPALFMPLDTLGVGVHRVGLKLQHVVEAERESQQRAIRYRRPSSAASSAKGEEREPAGGGGGGAANEVSVVQEDPPQMRFAPRECLVTLYTKSALETLERGVIVKIYERASSRTSVLHLGASEIMRQCESAREPDLLRDYVTAIDRMKSYGIDEQDGREHEQKETEEVRQGGADRVRTGLQRVNTGSQGVDLQEGSEEQRKKLLMVRKSVERDDLAQTFSRFTAQGDREAQVAQLQQRIVDIVLGNLAYFLDPHDLLTPCVKNHPLGYASVLEV